MKKMKKMIFVLMFLVMTNIAFAETKSDGASETPKEVVVKVPGAGEDVVVNVPYVVQRIHEFSPPATSNFRLRGGLSTGFSTRLKTRDPEKSFMGGLIGEIGTKSVMIQAVFRAGNCKGYGLALNSELTVMKTVSRHFRIGVGADLLYCSDVSDPPKEKSNQRIIGGSLRYDTDLGRHFVVGTSWGIGAATAPFPGGRDTKAAYYMGVNISYLWGD